MKIRNYQPGDEAGQAAIYNAAALALPKFKPATAEEVKRRCRARDFDPGSRFYAEVDGQVVGYATSHANGRVSYPWCLPGHEAAAEPLFARALQAMTERGQHLAFAAYRGDWAPQQAFLLAHGFHLAREIVNYLLDPVEMPTSPGSRRTPLTPLRPEDLPAVLEMGAGVLRTRTPAELEAVLLHNPLLPPDSLFVFRSREDNAPLAIGLLVADLSYANPLQVDAGMPCFRLGAFGAEGMQTKKINGLFSFLAADRRNTNAIALDLLDHAAFRLEEAEGGPVAAQAPSDAPHLAQFYNRYFRRQGSFPIFERTL